MSLRLCQIPHSRLVHLRYYHLVNSRFRTRCLALFLVHLLSIRVLRYLPRRACGHGLSATFDLRALEKYAVDNGDTGRSGLCDPDVREPFRERYACLLGLARSFRLSPMSASFSCTATNELSEYRRLLRRSNLNSIRARLHLAYHIPPSRPGSHALQEHHASPHHSINRIAVHHGDNSEGPYPVHARYLPHQF